VTSSLAVVGSSAGGFTAVGSESGVVNIYSNADIALGGASVKPLKGILNLTTGVDCLRFNHDGQLLAMSSCFTRDALRVVRAVPLPVAAAAAAAAAASSMHLHASVSKHLTYAYVVTVAFVTVRW
jgi:hypothetical protein